MERAIKVLESSESTASRRASQAMLTCMLPKDCTVVMPEHDKRGIDMMLLADF